MTASGASCVAAPAAADFTLLSSSNAATIPMTVPSRPMNGALFPSVPRNARRFSASRAAGARPSMASSAAATPRSASTRPATTTAASALRDTSSRRRAPSMSRREQPPEIAHQDLDVVAQRPVEPDALEHDGQRDDAQEQHEGEDPTGPQPDHRALHSFNQGIHVAMAPSVSSSSAGGPPPAGASFGKGPPRAVGRPQTKRKQTEP